MKKLLLVLFAICLLTGCGSSSAPEKLVCSGKTAEVIDVTNVLEYDGDKVLKQTMTNEVSLDALGISEDTLNGLVEQYKTAYDVAGVTYTTEIKDGVFKEEVKIDFEKADLKVLASIGLIDAEEEETITYVSLKQTKEALETFGFTCE